MIRHLADRLMKTGDIQRQSFLHFGTSICITVLGFLSTMAITHLAGSPDVPGGYFLFLSYVGIFSLISSGGLGGATVHRMADKNHQREVFSAFLILRIILLIGSSALVIIITPLLVDLSAAGLAPWLIGAIFVTCAADITGTWVYGTGRAGFIQISTLVNNLTRIIVQVLAILTGYGVGGLAGGVVAGIVAGTLFLLPMCGFGISRFTWSTVRDLLRFSFWSLLASGGMIIYGNIDTILLGYYASTSEVGLYRISLQLASFSLFTALALNTILYPKFVEWQRDTRKTWISQSLARAISYSLLLALPVCIGGMILGSRLLYFLYGSPYEAAGTALSLLLTTQVAYVFVFLWTMTLSAIGRPMDSAKSALIATIINIPLNLSLIPSYGINGAACAILITVLIHALCAGLFLKNYIRLAIDYRALRSISIAVLMMAGIAGIIRILTDWDHVILMAGTIIICASVYLAILMHLERGVDTALRKMMRDMGIILPEWM